MSYWTRTVMSRRTALRRAAVAGGGLVALSLVGCGGNSKKDNGPDASASVAPEQGKQGGKVVVQGSGDPGTLVMVATFNNSLAQLAGYTHSGLLVNKNGRPGADGTSLEAEPDLAQALPEQAPDGLTYTFKLKQANFHNGRAITAADVKYSFDRYAFWEGSAYRLGQFAWLDKVEAPDSTTVVIKSKTPYADALNSMAAKAQGFILCKEHEEGPDAKTKLLGSGPYLFVSSEAPVSFTFKRNPDYFKKPLPYFDDLVSLAKTDPAKKVSDFISKQVHVTSFFDETQRDDIKKARPDARQFFYLAQAPNFFMRADQPPFNDQRVRLALALTLNRKALREAATKGEGEDDQVLSFTADKRYGFRKPAELGVSAKNWDYDPARAKQLLSAAGINQPIESSLSHWDPTVLGQGFVDQTTLAETNWRSLGIANFKDIQLTFGQSSTTIQVGNYDGMFIFPNGLPFDQAMGNRMRSDFFSPPEGVQAPTTNWVHVNDPKLSDLVDKQRGQLDLNQRKQTFKAIEDILAEQMYRIPLSTGSYNYFLDPSVKGFQIPRDSYNSSLQYINNGWFA